MKKVKWGFVLRWAAVFLLVAGLTVYGYPHFMQWQYDRMAAKMISEYEKELDRLRDDKNDPLDDLLKVMRAYNKTIYQNKQEGLTDPFAYETPSFDLKKWGLTNDIIGTIEIPRMEMKLPILLGATEENMKLGAVHLSGTSLPIGEKNTNTVIAAHRGYYKAKMFRNIHTLQIGDEIYITNPWEKLTYKVTEIKIIYPNEIERILIQQNRQMLTLSSCHPPGRNSRRYIVYCERAK